MRLHTPAVRAVRRTRSAFTLLEILIVVSIIVVLAGTGYYYFVARGQEAKLDVTKAKIDAITSMCDQFYTKYSKWPQTLEELMAPPEGGAPYVKSVKAFHDGWGQVLQYDASGQKFNGGGQPDIWCERNGEVLWHNGPNTP